MEAQHPAPCLEFADHGQASLPKMTCSETITLLGIIWMPSILPPAWNFKIKPTNIPLVLLVLRHNIIGNHLKAHHPAPGLDLVEYVRDMTCPVTCHC